MLANSTKTDTRRLTVKNAVARVFSVMAPSSNPAIAAGELAC